VPLHVIRDWLGHMNIAMTSTHLGVNVTVSHEFMARSDAQQTALQPIATASKTRGSTKTRTTVTRHVKLNKTELGHVSRMK
jgi:hypothetical protein